MTDSNTLYNASTPRSSKRSHSPSTYYRARGKSQYAGMMDILRESFGELG